MTTIETRTTHTVKLSWRCNKLISKGELLVGLRDALPDGVEIAHLAIEDVADIERGGGMRTLTITYVGGIFGRRGW